MQTQRATPRKPAAPAIAKEDFGPAERLNLARAVVAHLVSAKKTVSVAESCTGGLIAAAITDVPGASKAFVGGVITYATDTKAELLGVPECMIAQHGVVSAEVAAAMAAAVAEKFGTDYGLAATGYAGPTGGTEADPVGTVYLGLHTPDGLWACRLSIEGERTHVRERAVEHALNWVRRKLKHYKTDDIEMGE